MTWSLLIGILKLFSFHDEYSFCCIKKTPNCKDNILPQYNQQSVMALWQHHLFRTLFWNLCSSERSSTGSSATLFSLQFPLIDLLIVKFSIGRKIFYVIVVYISDKLSYESFIECLDQLDFRKRFFLLVTLMLLNLSVLFNFVDIFQLK